MVRQVRHVFRGCRGVLTGNAGAGAALVGIGDAQPAAHLSIRRHRRNRLTDQHCELARTPKVDRAKVTTATLAPDIGRRVSVRPAVEYVAASDEPEDVVQDPVQMPFSRNQMERLRELRRMFLALSEQFAGHRDEDAALEGDYASQAWMTCSIFWNGRFFSFSMMAAWPWNFWP